jgi:gas vesicle protein
LGVYTHACELERAHNQSLKPTVKTTMVLLIHDKNTTSIHNNEIIYNYKTTTKQLQNNYKTTTKQLQNNYKTTTKQLQNNYNTTTKQLQNNYKTTRKQLEFDYGVVHHR